MLLAVLGSRRPTGDVDLLARAIDNDVPTIADVVRNVLSVPVDDGVTYEVDAMTTQVIRDASLYSGVRLSVPPRIQRVKMVLRLDVNVGDPVTPHPVDVEYPASSRPFVPFAWVPAGHRSGGKDRHDDRARSSDDA